jgi:hypothetical protein
VKPEHLHADTNAEQWLAKPHVNPQSVIEAFFPQGTHSLSGMTHSREYDPLTRGHFSRLTHDARRVPKSLHSPHHRTQVAGPIVNDLHPHSSTRSSTRCGTFSVSFGTTLNISFGVHFASILPR